MSQGCNFIFVDMLAVLRDICREDGGGPSSHIVPGYRNTGKIQSGSGFAKNVSPGNIG